MTLLTCIVIETCAQPRKDSFFSNRPQVENWIKRNNVPALGIGLITEGKLREVNIYGELTPGRPAPRNALFNVASLTKPVVAMLVLKLVSTKNWDLDEPLSNYWIDPDIASDPRHKKITTRIVLSHQTGFKNWRYLNDSSKLKIEFEPGTKFGYSGEGFEYLRKALERKFKIPLPKLADSLIFLPLGMKDTRFGWDKSVDESRFALWHDTSGINMYKDHRNTTVNAADDLLTTVEDYGKLLEDVAKGGGLDSSVYNQMVRPHVPTNKGLFMGLGWEMFLDLGPRKEYALVHSGSDRGVKTLAIVFPMSKQGLVIFTNGDRGNTLYEKIIVEKLALGQEMWNKAK